MNYSIYSKTTGQIVRCLLCTEDDLLLNYDTSIESYLSQEIDGHKFYVDVSNQQIIEISPKPNTWSNFDFVTKQWVADSNEASKQIIKKRDELLYKTDWTQIPNNPLTAEQQGAYATYRQQLRDIPQQSGYPLNVVFPVAPI